MEEIIVSEEELKGINEEALEELSDGKGDEKDGEE